MSKRSKRQRAAANEPAQSSRSRHDGPPVDWLRLVLLAALVALVAARIFVPEDPGGQQGFGAPFDVMWLLLAAAWLFGQLRHSKLELRFGWPDTLVVALVGWHTVSALVAVQSGSPRAAMNMLWEWVAVGLVFVLGRQIVGAGKEARAVIVVMIGLAAGLTAAAVYQYFVTIPADIAKFESGNVSTESLFEQVGQWLPPGSPGRLQFEARLRSGLATGTFALSNSLAGFLVPWLVVLAGLLVACPRGWKKWVCFVVVCGMAACMWLTGSRTGGVAAIVGVLASACVGSEWLHLSRRWRAILGSTVLVSILVAVLIAASTSTGHAALEAAWRSLAFRIEYWRATTTMIRDHLLFGCGPGQFQDTYTAYKLVGAAEEVQDPHNWLLEVWGTAGTPAVLLLLGALAAIIVRVVRGNAALDSKDDVPMDTSNVANASLALDATTFGGLAGVALGMAVAWVTGFPVTRMTAVLLVLGIVMAWPIGKAWVLNGKLPRSLLLIAAIAMLINLSAAGGIGFPSVADTLWLLLAIAVNITDATADIVVIRSLAWRWLAGLVLGGALVAAIWIEYLPVMACRLQISIANAELAESRGDLATTALEEAVKADPWSAEAARQLAAQRFAAYESLPTSTQIRGYMESDARARALAPHHSGQWAESAGNLAAIFQATQNVEYRAAAEKYLERAIALYPTLSRLRVQAAQFWQSIGAVDRARSEAAEAVRFDDAMRTAGHTDRVLDESTRREMQSLAGNQP